MRSPPQRLSAVERLERCGWRDSQGDRDGGWRGHGPAECGVWRASDARAPAGRAPIERVVRGDGVGIAMEWQPPETWQPPGAVMYTLLNYFHNMDAWNSV